MLIIGIEFSDWMNTPTRGFQRSFTKRKQSNLAEKNFQGHFYFLLKYVLNAVSHSVKPPTERHEVVFCSTINNQSKSNEMKYWLVVTEAHFETVVSRN